MQMRWRWVARAAQLALAVSLVGSAALGREEAAGLSLTARALLDRLPVRAEAGASSYDRDRFGYPADLDGDDCDTRAEVLMLESTSPTTRSASCTIRSGRWYSFVDGRTWTDPSAVQIDHLVALAEAWASGARSWGAQRLRAYGNDLGYAWSLNAITGSVNAAKGDDDPAEWLPPRVAARCSYAIRWIKVKFRWGLSIDVAERGALIRLLAGTCGDRLVSTPPRA